MLALTWAKKLGVELSIIDINQASVPMAYTIVQDNTVIFGENNYCCMVEEQRIMSKWELDYCYHTKPVLNYCTGRTPRVPLVIDIYSFNF
jgi:hypothetical protein